MRGPSLIVQRIPPDSFRPADHQCAADHGAWVVTNDAWRDHNARRHANDELRKRRVAYAWMGRTFAPASDDLARFDASRSVR